MLKDFLDLLARGTRKPLKKLVHRSTPFEVLEKGAHRHLRSPKNPRAADFLRIALHGRASSPIEHAHTLLWTVPEGKRAFKCQSGKARDI